MVPTSTKPAGGQPPNPIHTYNDGQPYRTARGRHQPRESVEHFRFSGHPIVRGFPTAVEFIRVVKREMKIRCYAQSSIKNYTSCLTQFLRWFGALPHKVDTEDVRNYLEILVDGGADSSTIAGNLSALRTCFDKFCGRDITLGLATPRRRKIQPVILSPQEVSRIIDAAPNFTIKLAIGIMYAAGLRNKELCRLRVEDLDFDRGTIRVFQGKGRTDRLVMLPSTFRVALTEISADRSGDSYLFPSLKKNRKGRYLSPRTLQRWVKVCAALASIKKCVTPHSFRHAFATHLLENGTDIRFIQKLLGHQRLETTTIYTRVAQIRAQKITSPLDHLKNSPGRDAHPVTPTDRFAPVNGQQSVGKLSLQVTLRAGQKSADVDMTILGRSPISLPGIVIEQTDRNWVNITLPAADQWRSLLDLLPPRQRERIESPEFYELLRAQLAQRFLSLLPGPSG